MLLHVTTTKQSLHTCQQADNIPTDNTLVEGTHGQQGTRLTNGLSSNNTDCFADIDQLARSHGLAVALRTDAGWGLTSQNRADLDLWDASLNQLVSEFVGQVCASFGDDIALGILDICCDNAARSRGLPQLVDCEGVFCNLFRDWNANTLTGATVVFANDDILRNVNQTTGQVARVSGTQRGIGQTLTGTVGVVEVLQNRQTFTEGSLNRTGDVVTLRVHNHALHTGQGPDLTHVTCCTRLHDHRNCVVIWIQ